MMGSKRMDIMKDGQKGEGEQLGIVSDCTGSPWRESDAKEDSRRMRKTVMRKEQKQVQAHAGGDG